MVGDERSCCACDGAFVSWLRHCTENRRLRAQAWLRRGSTGRYVLGRVGQGDAGMAEHALLMGHSALQAGGHVFHVRMARGFRGGCRGFAELLAGRQTLHAVAVTIIRLHFFLQCHPERRT